MNNKKLKPISSMMLVMLLGGCAQMNSKFDCPMKPGVRCESLDRVNARVDRGELDSTSASSISYENTSDISSHAPFRSNEKIMHVWIAPYVDKDGNYHDGNNIYAIRKASEWKGI